jgi:hypothetical protein
MSIEFSKHAENASEAAEKSGKMPPFVAASGKRVCGFRIRTRENTPSDAETTPKRHPSDAQTTRIGTPWRIKRRPGFPPETFPVARFFQENRRKTADSGPLTDAGNFSSGKKRHHWCHHG